MDPDSHNVAGRNASRIQRLQSFVNDHRIAEAGWRGGGEHIKPSRRDDADAKGFITRVDEMDFQRAFPNATIMALASVARLSPAYSTLMRNWDDTLVAHCYSNSILSSHIVPLPAKPQIN